MAAQCAGGEANLGLLLAVEQLLPALGEGDLEIGLAGHRELEFLKTCLQILVAGGSADGLPQGGDRLLPLLLLEAGLAGAVLDPSPSGGDLQGDEQQETEGGHHRQVGESQADQGQGPMAEQGGDQGLLSAGIQPLKEQGNAQNSGAGPPGPDRPDRTMPEREMGPRLVEHDSVAANPASQLSAPAEGGADREEGMGSGNLLNRSRHGIEIGTAGIDDTRGVVGGPDQGIVAADRHGVAEAVVACGVGVVDGLQQGAGGDIKEIGTAGSRMRRGAGAAINEIGTAGIDATRVVERGPDKGNVAADPQGVAEAVVTFGSGVVEGLQQGAGGDIKEIGTAGIGGTRGVVGGPDQGIVAADPQGDAEEVAPCGSGVVEGLQQGAGGDIKEIGTAGIDATGGVKGGPDQGIVAADRHGAAEDVVDCGIGVVEGLQQGAGGDIKEIGAAGIDATRGVVGGPDQGIGAADRYGDAEVVVDCGSGIVESLQQGAEGDIKEIDTAGIDGARGVVGGPDQGIVAADRQGVAEEVAACRSGVVEGLQQGAGGDIKEVGTAGIDAARGVEGGTNQGIVAADRHGVTEDVEVGGSGVVEGLRQLEHLRPDRTRRQQCSGGNGADSRECFGVPADPIPARESMMGTGMIRNARI